MAAAFFASHQRLKSLNQPNSRLVCWRFDDANTSFFSGSEKWHGLVVNTVADQRRCPIVGRMQLGAEEQGAWGAEPPTWKS